MDTTLTQQVHERLKGIIRPGDKVIDATVGNGHDTLYLANAVGQSGRVFGFDIQSQAIASARERLNEPGNIENISWFCDSHEHLVERIPVDFHGTISVAMFNLGYLPGGDKNFITHTETTLSALQQAYELLTDGGVLSIIAYPGHPGGREETEAVRRWCRGLGIAICEEHIPDSQTGSAPEWFYIIKQKAV